MNKLILQYLNEYCENPDPQYAVMLSGKWGCGKTYFIKEWVESIKTTSSENFNEEEITLEPIYISVYGMTAISDIKNALDREINPFFYSKTGKILKNTGKILGKLVFKTSFDIDGNGKEDTTFSASIDSLSLFSSSAENIKGTKLLIFDDIERCQIDIKQLLGFINGFVEHCQCHVVVLGDVEHLADKKEAFDEFKEKTIGREFEIQPDIETAVKCFLSEELVCNYLQSQQDFIIDCFIASGYNNLRVLRQCLYDFKRILFQIEGNSNDNENSFLHSFLGCFIATYFEYANKNNNPLICKWEEICQNCFFSKDSEQINKINEIKSKYRTVSKKCTYELLSPDFVSIIVEYISKGKPIVSYIQNNIVFRPKELLPFEKLINFQELNNSEFESIYESALNDAIKGTLNSSQLGTTIALFALFHKEGIHYFFQAHISLLKKQVKSCVDGVSDLEELYKLKSTFVRGCNHIHSERNSPDIITDFLDFFDQEFQKRSETLPDEMQLALRNLSEDNVYSLSDIDKESYPDHSSTYELRSIFATEDARQLFNQIKRLSNMGREEFSHFLYVHYKLNYNISNYRNRYESDLPVLLELKGLIDKEIINSISVDRYVFKNLSDIVGKSIKQINGSN